MVQQVFCGDLMKRQLMIIATLLCTTVFAQQEVSFIGVSPKVGQTFVRTMAYKMNADVVLKFAGQTLEEHRNDSTFTVRKSETVLATNGDAVTKLKVAYELIDRKIVITEDGIPEEQKPEKSPVVGRTYVVTAENGSVKVTDPAGLKPSFEEIDIVQGDYEGLGEPDSYLQFLHQKTVQIGEPLQMPGLMAAGIFRDAERRQVKVDKASFALKSLRNNIAVFDTALKMQWNEDANTSLKMNLTGETLIGIRDSRLVSSTLGGTVRITGTDQIYNRLVMVDGKGNITMTQSLKLR
jgi:hypothetical protein